jgi:hypothetical protein
MALKKNSPIPDDNHIVRQIPWTKLRKDENDNVIGILGEAFKMRESESYLSANWLEYFSGSFDEQVISTIQEIRKCVTVKPKSGFAIGKVEAIKNICSEKKNCKIRIVYSPSKTKAGYENFTHVAVQSLPEEDMELFELLATEAWDHLVLNSSVQI